MNDQTNNTPWIQRFGKLEDVTPRTGANGEYVTFKMSCGEFDQIGAAFGEDAVAFLKASVGKRIWVKGPLEPRTVMQDGEKKDVKSFKAVYFKELTEDQKAPEQEAVAEAA